MPRAAKWVLFVTVAVLLVLGGSGRWDDALLRAYVGVWAVLALLAVAIVPAETARARLRRGPAGADPLSPPVFRVLFLAHLAAGVLDARFGWTGGMPSGPRLAGMGLMAGAYAFVGWAVAVNRFFIPAVRIQAERGHTLVTSGPYGVVRHPGYAGLLLAVPASGLALGSWLAVGLGLVMSLFVLRRVVVEDRFVMAQLPGYAEYAARVRARLIPGIW
jgi:protein-S-isoprenylcysteine O-methyltransferase Ste14